ncbi:hypothetical protein E4T66_18660 [Sinimarinibacterium sp. CAU 1509]|uniref:hypothetical protein n=1 Tax=Sinimarinibacterium sp. CAU 1509 TaxID=2562283 RepID=UPI0010ACE588|nr:hypothetical protein [Sinimarinibacterium sp. CAU 1509]TJY57430.1 hypothetical protein E4T66_18660 [Sinimarinibacterium sp. CAU 1509]
MSEASEDGVEGAGGPLLLVTLAKSLCEEYFRGQIELTHPGDDARYRKKIEAHWHEWVPQAQAVLDKG